MIINFLIKWIVDAMAGMFSRSLSIGGAFEPGAYDNAPSLNKEWKMPTVNLPLRTTITRLAGLMKKLDDDPVVELNPMQIVRFSEQAHRAKPGRQMLFPIQLNFHGEHHEIQIRFTKIRGEEGDAVLRTTPDVMQRLQIIADREAEPYSY